MSEMAPPTVVVVTVTDEDGYDIPVVAAIGTTAAFRAFDEWKAQHEGDAHWRPDLWAWRELPVQIEASQADRITALQAELEAIRYAAHMPADYAYGLPAWINTQLYGKLILLTDTDGRPIRRSEDMELMVTQAREIKRLREALQQAERVSFYTGTIDETRRYCSACHALLVHSETKQPHKPDCPFYIPQPPKEA